MFAVYVESFNPDDPLAGLVVGERPEPQEVGEVPDGWTTVTVKAASLNHHDLFSLRGIGLKQEQLPMIVGTDAAGLDEDGNEVVVHGVISSPGASVPRIIGSCSALSPTPRSENRSWWLSEAALTVIVVQPSGSSGSGRSPTTSPDSGSSGSKDSA